MERVNWTDRTKFAEFAEALEVTTDCIMSASMPGGSPMWVILYTLTPTADEAEMIWLALLQRQSSGILQVVRRDEHKTIGEFNQGLTEHMNKAMGKGE